MYQQHAKYPLDISVEVLAHLVVAPVFKTVGSCDKRGSGGFDSHALPPFFLAYSRDRSHDVAYLRLPQQVESCHYRHPAKLREPPRVPAVTHFVTLARRFARRFL